MIQSRRSTLPHIPDLVTVAEVITTTCEPPEFLRGLGCNSAGGIREQPPPRKT